MIEAPAVSVTAAARARRDSRLDYDVREIAMSFGEGHARSLTSVECASHGTNTFGGITFQRVDPLHEPLKVADARLQSRLEVLCETLQAKY